MDISKIAVNVAAFGPKILNLAVTAIHGVEALFGAGRGTDKKQLVLDLLTNAVQAVGIVAGVNGDAVKASLAAAIDAIVKLFNDLGVFTKAVAAA